MPSMPTAPRPAVARAVAAIVTILSVGAILRLWDLAHLPPAHYRDVAITALDALSAAAGHPRLHYVYDEGLFANLMGLVFLVLGAGDAAVRLPGALAGLATCYGVARLGRALGAPRAGLYGAALLAVSLWHVILSRSGFRAVLLPLVLVFSMALLVEGLRGGRTWRMAGAGALFGLMAHTYPASRAAVLIVPLYLSAELGLDSTAWRRATRGLLLFALTASVVAGPMLVHYLRHPRDFNNPDRIVSVFSPRLEAGAAGAYLKQNVAATAGMFHLCGDTNGRHNLPGAPLLDPLTGALFIAGLLIALGMPGGRFAGLAARPRGTAGLLLAWVPVMLLPNLLSVEGVPHALRSAGVLPAVMLLAGFGAQAAVEFLGARAGRRVTVAVVILAGLLMAGATARRYFVVWGRDPAIAAAHDAAYRAAARLLLAAPPGVGRYLVANGTGFPVHGHPAEVQSYMFELRAAPPVILGPKDAAALVLGGRPALVALVRRDDTILEVIRNLNPGATIEAVTAPGLSPDSPVYRIN